MTLDIGIHDNIPHEVYHSDPCETPSLSVSIAKILLGQSPAHAFFAHPRLGGAKRKEKSSAVIDRGTLIHDLLLDGGPGYEIVEADNWTTKAARAERDQIRQEGKIPVLSHVYEEAVSAVGFIAHQLDLTGMPKEQTFVWLQPTTGTRCRGRRDLWDEASKTIIDFKTCKNANAASSPTNILKMGYDIQAAAYIEAASVLDPNIAGRVGMAFYFCEVNPPFGIKRVYLDQAFLSLGQRKWVSACAAFAECLKSGVWPNYPDRHIRAEAPAWALSQALTEQYSQLGANDGDNDSE